MLTNTAEGGTDSAVANITNTGGASGDIFTYSTGTAFPVFATGAAKRGLRGYSIPSGNALGGLGWTFTASNSVAVQFWIFMGTTPLTDTRMIHFRDTTPGTVGGLLLNTNQKIRLMQRTSGVAVSESPALSLNTWYCIDMWVTNTSPGTVAFKITDINNTLIHSYSGAFSSTALPISTFGFGRPAAGDYGGTFYFDDIRLQEGQAAFITDPWPEDIIDDGISISLSSLKVWNGTTELPNTSVAVWEDGIEKPAKSVWLYGIEPEGPDGAGADPVGTASYTIPVGSIYVAPTGSDTTGTGLIGAPYATLSKAHSMVATNGTIVMRAGSYHEGADWSSGTTPRYGLTLNKSNFTVMNYPGEAVWFDGSVVHTGWTPSGSAWSKNIVMTFDRSPTESRGALDGTVEGWQYVNPSYPCAAWPEQVFVDGVELTQVNSLANVGPGKFYIAGTTSGTNNTIFTSSTYYLGTDPTGKEVRISDKCGFAVITGDNNTFKGFGIRRFANSMPDWGVLSLGTAPGTTLEQITVENGMKGICIMSSSHDINMTKVTVTKARNVGVAASYSNNILATKCKFTFNTVGMFNRAPVSGGWKGTKSMNSTFIQCIISDNYQQGLWWDESVTGMKAISCNMQRNGGNGVVPEISEALTMVNCLVTDNGRSGLYNSGVNNSRIWCNTFKNNSKLDVNLGNAYVFQDTRRPATFAQGMDGVHDLTWHQANCSWDIHAFEFKNNISDEVGQTASSLFRMVDPGKTQGGWNGMGLDADGNLYCQKDANLTNAYLVPITSTSSSSTGFASLPPYKTYVSPEEPNSVEVRGGGVCVLDANYRLTSAAQALTATTARPLPADIAALIDVPEGTTHLGAWR
jgi:hypothetical protein